MLIGRGSPPADVKVAGEPPPDERPPSATRVAGLRVPGGKTALIAAAATVTVLVGGGTALALTRSSGDGGDSGTVAPARPASDLAADAMRPVSEKESRQLVTDRASRAARRDAAKHPVLAVRGTTPPTPKKTEQPTAATAAPAGNPVPAGEAQRIAKGLLPKYGFDPDTQFGCLVNLWNKESHWNVHAGSPSGPYGIPQSNPGDKMASAGSDWLDSATTQINWGLGYIKARYSGPCGAWSHSQSTGWY
jgi:hypothetical protein